MVLQKKCRNALHSEWIQKYGGNEPNISLLKRPKSREKCAFEDLCGKKFVRSFVQVLICQFCLDKVYELHPNALHEVENSPLHGHEYSTPTLKQRGIKKRRIVEDASCLDDHESPETLCQYDAVASLDEEKFQHLAYEVGKRLGSSVRIPKEQTFKSVDSLKHMDVKNYLQNFDPSLLCLLDGMNNEKKRDNDDYRKAKCAEYLLHLLHPSAILSLCFMENLLMYNTTNSKQAANLLGDSGPYGHYDAVRLWLSQQSMDPLPFPEKDCVVIFDNNQVIGRSWNIKVNNKSRSSTVTTICQIEFPYNQLQRQVHLKPKFWNTDVDKLLKNVREIPQELTDTHYKHLYSSLARNLQVVIKQQRLGDDDNYTDDFDQKVQQNQLLETTKICSKCGQLNTKTKRMCANDECRVNLKQAEAMAIDPEGLGTFTKKEKSSDPGRQKSEVRLRAVHRGENKYVIEQSPTQSTECSTSHHPDNAPVLTLSDPCFVNPNSYDSCRTVLRQIGLQAGIKLYCQEGKREWVFIVCDGLPFGMCQHVMKNTYRCKLCPGSTESFVSKETLKKHHIATHESEEVCGFLEFDWVVLRPGNGHFEMNMCKTFIEVNWDVFFSELCRLMGFRSENAQRAAKKCTDHHKTWSLLRIAHEGLLQELMVPYVRKTLQSNEPCTPTGFIKFVMTEAKNPNYIYMATMTMTYLEALQNFRSGLRSGDMEKITSAKAIFAPLFHARHHPHYQEIEMVEAVQRQSVPQDLKPFFDQTESVCLSEDKMTGEGLDFKAEVVNKDVQSWMPRGVPSGEDWLRVTRNLENLKEIRAKAKEVMGTTSSNQTRQSKGTDRDLSEQVSAWRVHLRASDYLDQPLNGSMNHISLTAEELDCSLLDITNLAENSRKRFFDKVILGLNEDDNVQDPVYVTKKEREEKNLISNKTKSEIADTISSLLGNIPIPDLKNSLQTDFTKMMPVAKVKKCDLLKFHDIVLEACSQQDVLFLPMDL